MILTSLTKFRDQGLLFLRLALGSYHIYAVGWRLLAGGARRWVDLGLAMTHVGIHFWFVFWGFMDAFSQSVGCVLLVLGLFFRPACILLFLTMAITAIAHRNVVYSLEMAILYFSLLFIGPGKFSVDKS